MTEIEFLRAEYQTLVARMGVLSSLSLTVMELVLAKDPSLAMPVLESMREKLSAKRYAGDPAVAEATLATERALFENEIAPFLKSIRQ
jgi:hypothetical protein